MKTKLYFPLFLSLVCTLWLSPNSFAAGELDTGFGSNGVAELYVDASMDWGNDMVIDSSGRILVAGTVGGPSQTWTMVARYNSNGTLDTSFGISGYRLYEIIAGKNSGANAIALFPNGDIAVAGWTVNAAGTRQDFALLSLGPNGAPNTGFNSTGKLAVAMGTSDAEAMDVLVDANDNILAVGYAYNGTELDDFALLRVTSAGALDTGFNGTGKRLDAFNTTTTDKAHAVTLQGTNIVVAGETFATNQDMVVAVYTDAGVPDITFNDTLGYKVMSPGTGNDVAYDVAIDGNNMIVVAGKTQAGDIALFDNVVVIRMDITGINDSTFNTTGVVVTAVGSGNSYATSLAIGAGNEVLLAGRTNVFATDEDAFLLQLSNTGVPDGGFNGGSPYVTNISPNADSALAMQVDGSGRILLTGQSGQDLWLARFTSTPAPDTSFAGTGSVLHYDFGINTHSYATAVTQDSQGRLILAGASQMGTSGSAMTVARFLANGSLDTSFHGRGFNRIVSLFNDEQFAVTTDSSDRVYVAGRADTYIYLARFDAAGELDTAFGTGGIGIYDGIKTPVGVNRIAVDAGGNTYVLGYIGSGTAGNLLLTRFTSAGLQDDTFAGGGIILDTAGFSDIGYDLALDAGNQPTIIATASGSLDTDIYLARYTTGGNPDTTLNGSGSLLINLGGNEEGRAIAIDTGNRIILGGKTDSGAILRRYSAAGVLDATFGTSGTTTSTAYSAAHAISLDSSDRLLVGGTTATNTFALTRYSVNGVADSTFGSGGTKVMDWGLGTQVAEEVILTASDQPVAVVSQSPSPDSRFMMARFLKTTPPVLSGTPTTTTAEDSAYSFIPTLTDPDVGEAHSYSITNKPVWAQFDTATGELSGTPTNQNVGSYSNIVISVTDSGGLSGSLAAFSIDVTNTNDAPTLTGTPLTTVIEGQPYSFIVTGSDVDVGDTLSYSLSGAPAFLSVDAAGEVSGVPQRADVGSHSNIVVTVTDSSNANASLSPFTLTVVGDLDRDGSTDGVDPDIDGDGMDNTFEETYNLDPFDPADAALDSDGDSLSNLEEFLNGMNPTVDDVPPVVTPPAAVTLDASGLYTIVDLGVATAMDAVDGELVPMNDAPALFRPGLHTVVWTATDAAGNTGEAEQIVKVHPLLRLGFSQLVAEGSSVSVPVYLNGDAADYPVQMEYSISGSAINPDDHNLSAGTITISSGRWSTIHFDTVDDGRNGEGREEVLIQVDAISNAAPAAPQRVAIGIVEDNIAPRAALFAQQNGRFTRTIIQNQGEATITAVGRDINGDEISYAWDIEAIDNDEIPDTFTFDPTLLEPGLLPVHLVVSDNGEPSLSNHIIWSLRILAEAPELGSGDSDGDGIPDNVEGFGDDDGDGVPNFLDALDGINLLQSRIGDPHTFLLEGRAGQSMGLGPWAMQQGEGTPTFPPQLLDEKMRLDSLGPYYDFIMTTSEEPGASTVVVIALESPLPVDGVFALFINGKWQLFAEDEPPLAGVIMRSNDSSTVTLTSALAPNSLTSAPSVNGTCPPPGDEAYEEGLVEGNSCLQVSVEDGGENDVDEETNGSVQLTGTVMLSSTLSGATKKKGGGGGGALWWLLAAMSLLLGWQAMQRKNRRKE